MASLWKTANKQQYLLLKIIRGAVLNARDGHPEIQLNKRFAQGVAKRAVGTISATPKLLATDTGRLKLSSDKGESFTLNNDFTDATHTLVMGRTHLQHLFNGDGHSQRHRGNDKRGKSRLVQAYPFSRLHKDASRMMSDLKKRGKIEDMKALIKVCRMLQPLADRENGKAPAKAKCDGDNIRQEGQHIIDWEKLIC